MKNGKNCNICASGVSSLKVSPLGHESSHESEDERACGEAWLSQQVEKRLPHEIECLFCKATITIDDLQRLARNGTAYRYAEKLKTGLICMARCTSLRRPFDREKDGRVFTCDSCGFQVCVDCDRPEHADESCEEYQFRQTDLHASAEQQTRNSFRSCPGFKATIETEKCGFTQCHCGYRFCSRCMIPWVGEGSAYMLGKEAHGEGCLYRTRDKQSKHGLQHRFEKPEEAQARKNADNAVNKLKRDEERADLDESSMEEPGKKGKTELVKAEAGLSTSVKHESDIVKEATIKTEDD